MLIPFSNEILAKSPGNGEYLNRKADLYKRIFLFSNSEEKNRLSDISTSNVYVQVVVHKAPLYSALPYTFFFRLPNIDQLMAHRTDTPASQSLPLSLVLLQSCVRHHDPRARRGRDRGHGRVRHPEDQRTPS